MSKKVLVFLGHTNPGSFCRGLADAYAIAAQQKGCEVRIRRLYQMQFAPTIDFQNPSELEPDIAQLQSDLVWANHVALVYPIWWGAAPGLMKCALERTLLTGFAFKFHGRGMGWDQLLKGRTCEQLITMDTPPTIYRWLFGAAGDRIMGPRTFDFCGVKCIRSTHFGVVRTSTEQQRAKWLEKATQLGSKLG